MEKKVKPEYLGTGAAAKAGKAARDYNRRMKSGADAILREIQSDRTGVKNYKKCPDC
jgi:hypothetical protein